jgi:hypothetical protein
MDKSPPVLWAKEGRLGPADSVLRHRFRKKRAPAAERTDFEVRLHGWGRRISFFETRAPLAYVREKQLSRDPSFLLLQSSPDFRATV